MRRVHWFLAGLFWLLTMQPAHAWMAYTHEYLAELAVQEALTHGTVTIYLVDAVEGRRLVPIAVFKVDRDVISSILLYRGEYHAGLIGPDGYPDLITGMYGIHPDNSTRNRCGPSSDEWLQRIWQKSRGPLGTKLAEKAFALGFLQHAAGDMFAHDYLNYYTGGEWTERYHNALKHAALEAYVSRVTPESGDPHFYDLSVAHVQPFMVDTLIHTTLLSGDGGRYSVPAWVQALHSAPLNPRNQLRERLEFGLSQWPTLGTRLAQATMFNPQRRVDWDAADVAIHRYLAVLNAMVTEDEVVSFYQKFKSSLPQTEREDLAFDPFRFRPAYNTYVASQLCLLNASQLRRLATTLRKMTRRGPELGAVPANIMLGFLRSMNESHAWHHSSPQEPSFLLDRASFRLIFFDQRQWVPEKSVGIASRLPRRGGRPFRDPSYP